VAYLSVTSPYFRGASEYVWETNSCRPGHYFWSLHIHGTQDEASFSHHPFALLHMHYSDISW